MKAAGDQVHRTVLKAEIYPSPFLFNSQGFPRGYQNVRRAKLGDRLSVALPPEAQYSCFFAARLPSGARPPLAFRETLCPDTSNEV
jgi:hypothetical protein